MVVADNLAVEADSQAAAEGNSLPVAADNLVAEGIQVPVGDNLVAAGNPAVAAGNPAAEADNSPAVAAGSPAVEAAPRRMSCRTWRKRGCPGLTGFHN